MDRRFFFLHIRKTGGRTVEWRILPNIADDAWFPVLGDDGEMIAQKCVPAFVLGLPQQKLASIRFFSLHQGLWVRDEIATRVGVQPYTITILREPVDRALSHLKQIARLTRWQGTLEDLYLVPRIRDWMCWNHQVCQFVENQRDRAAMDAMERAVYAAPDPDTFETGHPIDLGPEAMARAKARLETVDAIGFTDHVTEFVDELAARFDWRVGPPEHANAAPPVAVSARLSELIEADSGPDIEFYAHARTVAHST